MDAPDYFFNFGTVCPEVKAGFGEAIPNKHFYDFPARENHKNFKCAYTLELLAVIYEDLRLAREILALCGFAGFYPAEWGS
ncbi:hypothetical protein FACS189492_2950 [Clostridia bacterium]|nr:hypothetical protein FACS189492_2950 [Clostridia bacterium]